MTKRIAATLVSIFAAAAFPGVASATYGPGADLVSINPVRAEQGDGDVQNAVISQDGRYVVFQTKARNFYPANDPGDPSGQTRVGGIFRWDRTTRTLELVAYGDLQSTSGSIIARGARNPSVSSDGRYVAFSTGWKLVAADTNPNADVYVRDMTLPPSSPDAYRLVSAKDGGTTPASWASTAPFAGAEVTPGVSISADGTKVLFRTGVASNLPNASSATTPGGQLFVRDLVADTTTLVTRNQADGSPAGGVNVVQPAALSADGTTVAWAGLNAQSQTRFLTAEPNNGDQVLYYLWRRIADGPGAPTRRLTGPVDLDDPACTPAEQTAYAGDPTTTGPCYGPFEGPEGDQSRLGLATEMPALSADGYRVAFVTGTFPRGSADRSIAYDLYMTDMHAGISRKAGTITLTTHGHPDGGVSDGYIISVAISSDGHRIAFVTGRTTFLLAGLSLVGPPLPTPGTPELYVIDLDRSQIELASRGLDGTGAAPSGVSNGPVSMSADGRVIAFTSGATNLFAGDANGFADAFVVTDSTQEQQRRNLGERPFSDYSWDPPATGTSATPKLTMSVRVARGRVRLKVKVPAPGTIDARARWKLGTLARKTTLQPRAGTATIVLQPKGRFRRVLRQRRRIRASLTVRFTPRASGPSLTAKRSVSFKS